MCIRDSISCTHPACSALSYCTFGVRPMERSKSKCWDCLDLRRSNSSGVNREMCIRDRNSSKPMGHQYDLVSIDGQIITEVREASQDEYVLSTDGRLFTAIYRHSRTSAPLLPMRQVPLGSRARITGICSIPDTHAINPGEEVPFDILLRSYDDIAIIANPSWLSVRNLLALVSMPVSYTHLSRIAAQHPHAPAETVWQN